MSSTFFNRRARLIIGGRQVDFQDGRGLRLDFRVTRSLSSDPNTCRIEVYNLGEEVRRAAQEGGAVQLQAGYGDRMTTLFVGNPDRVWSQTRGPDVVTSVTAGDGLDPWRNVRVRKSYGAGTPMRDIIRDLIDSAKLSVGNARSKMDEEGPGGVVREAVRGLTVEGPVMRQLEKQLADAGLEFSIQDGEVQVLYPGEVMPDTAVVLGPDSGMVGSPQIGLDGEVRISCLLNGQVYPGRAVMLEARDARGVHRARTVTHDGDTHGDQWVTTVEAQPIGEVDE